MSWLARQWLLLQSSLWFLPAVVVLGSMATAVGLVEASGVIGDRAVERWPRLFGSGAEASRQMLGSIAGSMITVAGVVLSITIVALSMAATQYSPRVLRNFMRDRPTQLVLGVFVGNFAYCLTVLRTIRQGEENGFVPSLAVLAGMVYAFAAIALLIFFIHHLAQSIQAPFIIARIAGDARAAIDHMFPQEIGQPAETSQPLVVVPGEWTGLEATGEGYVAAVASDDLLRFACEHDRVVRLRWAIGDFVKEGVPLVELSGEAAITPEQEKQLRRWIALGRQRTTEQDPMFGLQQLVDVAVKALSPGINDPSTALLCLDRLEALMCRLAGRRIPDAYRTAGGRLRVIAPVPDFRSMLRLAFGAVVHHARNDPLLLARILRSLDHIASACADPDRRAGTAQLAAAVHRTLAQGERTAAVILARRQAKALLDSLRRSRRPAGASGVKPPGTPPGASS